MKLYDFKYGCQDLREKTTWLPIQSHILVQAESLTLDPTVNLELLYLLLNINVPKFMKIHNFKYGHQDLVGQCNVKVLVHTT